MTTNLNIEKASLSLREKVLDKSKKKLLIARIQGSDQEKDLNAPPNCNGFGRIRHFHRKGKSKSSFWPSDPLPMDPVCKAFKLPEMEMIRAQVFQIAACNFKCWYCFVPYNLINADERYSAWFSPNDLITLYLRQPDAPIVIDLSGGQPDIVPEWVSWMMQGLKEQGLDEKVYLWSDDNLSTDFFWRFLSDSEKKIIAGYKNYSRVCCFKGYSRSSFSFNTRRDETLFKHQFQLMRMLMSLNIDLYAYTTFTTPTCTNVQDEMSNFMDSLQSINENLPLRTVPLEIIDFTPVKTRLNDETRAALRNQYTVIEYWVKELEARFSSGQRKQNIADIPLHKTK